MAHNSCMTWLSSQQFYTNPCKHSLLHLFRSSKVSTMTIAKHLISKEEYEENNVCFHRYRSTSRSPSSLLVYVGWSIPFSSTFLPRNCGYWFQSHCCLSLFHYQGVIIFDPSFFFINLESMTCFYYFICY